METTFTSWLTLAALGAFHGLNPGMGWLFAVALGMQEGNRNAVWRALIPLTLGHALSNCSCDWRCLNCRHRAVARDTAVAPGAPARRPRHSTVVSPLASALGGYAGRYGRSDALVFSDGIGTWGGPDGAAGVSIHDSDGRNSVLPREGSVDASSCWWNGYAGAWCRVSRRDRAGRVGRCGSLRARALAKGLDQPGCDLVGGIDCHRVPVCCCLRLL
jgi:hypothetical protein